MKIRRTAAVAATTALIAGGLALASTLPAEAAMDSNCGLSVTTPTTDGTTVYSTSRVQCSTYMDNTAVEVRNTIQEEVLVVWNSRRTSYKYSAGSQDLSSANSFGCNGHGTDNWRGVGYGETTGGGNTTKNGTTRSLTC